MKGGLMATGLVGLSLLSGVLAAAEVEGQLEWLRRVELSTPVSGRVAEVAVQPGQAVQQGEPLLSLDPRPFTIERDRRRAERDRFEEGYAEVEREWQRAQELYDRTLISDHDLELARIDFAQATAERMALGAALEQAELALDYSRLQAPFDAWVLARHIDAGELVVTSERSVPLLTLAPRGEMLAVAMVEPAQIRSLDLGDAIELRYAGKGYRGVVSERGLEPEQGRLRLAVRFAPEGRPLAGEPVSLELP